MTTARPSETSVCPKCGSEKVMKHLALTDTNADSPQIEVAGDPEAILFRDVVKRQLVADVCGKCGFCEIYVNEPEELYKKYETLRR